MLVVGLLLFAAAVVVGVAGVSANTGSEHQLVGGFGIFGYHVHDSAGKVFFAGLLIGAVAMLGFMMVADGLRRNAALRRELFRFRQDARARRRAARPAPVPAPTERVLAGTAPTSTSDTVGDAKSKDGGGGSGGASSTGDASTAGADTSAGASTSAERASARRSLRNWRMTRPTN